MHTRHFIKVSKLQKYLFRHYKVWEKKLVLYVFEKDNPKLPRKRKVSSHGEEEEAPVEFSKLTNTITIFYQSIEIVVNCICNRFQRNNHIEILQKMEKMLLKVLHEEDFDHELQQMSSFFSSNLHKFKLETQL